MKWETVIGLEVHAQLQTKSKLFSGASTKYGAEPNTQACLIDLGFPGTLPTLNEVAIDMAIKFGLAINAEIFQDSIFARKNYFYPDLPKGYQITQHHYPLIGKGFLDLQLPDGQTKRVRIHHVQLEEDSGKSLHEDFHGMTGIDLNRAGIPLIEIVAEPDLSSPEEAVIYLKTLRTLVRYLDICDGNMQEGSFRCDANISVRTKGGKKLGTRVEIKNLNSFRFVERALIQEASRQITVIEQGGEIFQETRLYDPAKNETRAMRKKEALHDYRFFPEPDLLPIKLTDEHIEAIRQTLPELPRQKQARFMRDYQLSAYDASILVSDRDIAHYYEVLLQRDNVDPKLAANWVIGDVLGALKKSNLTIKTCPIHPDQLATLLQRIIDGTISGKIAKTVFEAMWRQEGNADEVIEAQGLKQVTDTTEIDNIIQQVFENNPAELKAYQSGKTKLFGFFVGEVMKLSEGKANPAQVNELLKSKLPSV